MIQSKYMVSIHCMTYNHAPYIEDAMNGFCVQQTDFPFVAIIVDDASTDGEPEVIRQYLNAHFNMDSARQWETDDAWFIEAKHNTNVNCTFAVVLLKYNFWQAKKDKEPLMKEWMDTKYIAFCEGDDYWTDAEKLQKQISFLELHIEYVVCTHDFIRYYEKKNLYENKSSYSDFFSSNACRDKYFNYSLDNYFDGWWTQPLTAVYRNGKYLSLIPKQKYKYYRDDIFFYYVLKEGKGVLLSDIMGVYRIHDGGIWSGQNRLHGHDMEIYNAFCIMNNEGDHNAVKKMERSQLLKINIYENEGDLYKILKELYNYYKIAPLGSFLKILYAVIRNQAGILHAKLKMVNKQ